MNTKPVKIKTFNDSSANNPKIHYTLLREKLVNEGLNYVEQSRYLHIYAPRQGGKSTYFELLMARLRQEGYGVVQVNFESYRNVGHEGPIQDLALEAQKNWQVELPTHNLSAWQHLVKRQTNAKWVLIVDEIEGLNPELLPEFLHTIRGLYHSRRYHALKSVIIVGVSNLAGIMQDNTCPFNITDTFQVPYFSRSEVFELLAQHETETTALGQPQLFETAVKEKIWHSTAGQPGLVNSIAQQLTERYPNQPTLTLTHYHHIEDWYVRKALEKNTANILHKASQYRHFVEELIYLEKKVPFLITNPTISFLYTQGVIDEDANGLVTFRVPLYKQRLELAFAVKINGEEDQFFRNGFHHDLGFTAERQLHWPRIIEAFQDYVQRRSFRYFRAKDPESGQYLSIKESAMVYAFEAFIQVLLHEVNGRSYLEAHAGLGNSDLVININGQETVVEAKIFRSAATYQQGLQQLSNYAQSLGAIAAVYLVFIDTNTTLPNHISTTPAQTQPAHNGNTPLHIYHIFYDTEKDF